MFIFIFSAENRIVIGVFIYTYTNYNTFLLLNTYIIIIIYIIIIVIIYIISGKVKNAVVILVDLPFRPGSLVAFITASDTQSTTSTPEQIINGKSAQSELIQNLQKICELKLNQFLQPTLIHLLSEKDFQLLSNPKDNNNNNNNNKNQKLIDLALKVYLEKDLIKPRTDTETQVEEIWRQQLDSKSIISVTQSFFALGGDSLKAGKLVAAMRKKLGVQLSVADLLSAPTIG